MARVYGDKKGSGARTQCLSPFQVRGHLDGSKGQAKGWSGFGGHQINFSQDLPSTVCVEVNGISIHRDQKKEKYNLAFSLKGVSITVFRKELNN